MARLCDEPEVEAAWLMVRGFLAAHDDDPRLLYQVFVRAVACFEAAGNLRQACLQRVTIAQACVRLGAHNEAERTARMALAESERLGLTSALATAQHMLGLTLVRQEMLPEALDVLRAAIASFIVVDDQHMEAATRIYAAEAYRRAGDLEAAEAEARRAVAVLGRFPTYIPQARATLADALLAQGRAEEAIEEAQRGFDLLASLGHVEEGDVYVRVVHADALHAAGRPDAARAAIAATRDRVLATAARIDDEAWRRSFLDDVPENARTLALARRWLEQPPQA